jgi:SagB-type dehydrogenase family enzyme
VIALQYHHASKHYFDRFARSLGYLDWATQPNPFRRFDGAPFFELSRDAVAPEVPYDALFARPAAGVAIDDRSIADWLRCAMGLSAWKQFRGSRWALRVNPSSGNLHPTEVYVVRAAGVFHYASREHALEQRARLDAAAWDAFTGGRDGLLVALSSIHWREAWKYGERAFRYCQHDAGHAIGALTLSASRLGWDVALLPRWSDAAVATLLGLDRDDDFAAAEREEPECIAVVTSGDAAPWVEQDPAALVEAARSSVWQGTANRLSPDRVPWPIIDGVAAATRYPGTAVPVKRRRGGSVEPPISAIATANDPPPARSIIIQRRSAVAFDARSTLPKDRFLQMLSRLQPRGVPWDAIDWPPHVHLLLFVHRVDGLIPGVYAYLRDGAVLEEWRASMRPEFLWESVAGSSDAPLFLLVPADVTWPANRASCDQDIAADGFFSLGMIARLRPSLAEQGEWFYRRLFWECGLIGQVLYLEAEAASARATGIGCFYDDAVHELLGLTGDAWQSLYHFSMGVPVEDTRLTTEPGYEWETRQESGTRNQESGGLRRL